MRVKIINDNIVYMSFPSQKDLTFTMCRPQEFYEAKTSKLRGKVFSFETLLEHYVDKDGVVDYFSIWSGFNLPGYVLEDFFQKFELNSREKSIYTITRPFAHKPYYFIATKNGDIETLKHELVHAFYYLDPVYKQEANVLVKHMRSDLRAQLSNVLLEKGYAKKVIIDEINAYMATSGTKYLRDVLKLKVTKKDIKPFEDLAKKILRD